MKMASYFRNLYELINRQADKGMLDREDAHEMLIEMIDEYIEEEGLDAKAYKAEVFK